MLILCDETIAIPLKLIYEQVLAIGIFPNIWKSANLTPIHKKGDKQLVKNYRPISLLPIYGKMFEKIIFNQLYLFFTTNNLITKNQSGFRSGDSTTNQLLTLVNEIHESFDNRNSLEVRSVFLDISKAFDNVWHEGLIFKLKQNAVGGNVINLLGNDLEIGIKSKVNFFADDTMIYSVVHSPTLTASVLNHDLEIISQWAHQWKMSFNPEPQQTSCRSQKKIKITHPPLFFNGTIVDKVNEHKHLGLTLDSKLTFSKHIDDKLNKSRKLLGVLKVLSSNLPLHTLIQIHMPPLYN